MSNLRIPPRRIHTGDRLADDMQRTAQQAAVKTNDLESRVRVLEALFLEGRATIEMKNADQTITPLQLSRWVIRTSGALTAVRNLRGFPRPATEDETYCRLIHNDVTGGFNVNMVDTYGGTVAFGAGGSAVAQFTPTGPILYVL